jgi:hypothetical protein
MPSPVTDWLPGGFDVRCSRGFGAAMEEFPDLTAS